MASYVSSRFFLFCFDVSINNLFVLLMQYQFGTSEKQIAATLALINDGTTKPLAVSFVAADAHFKKLVWFLLLMANTLLGA